MKCYALATRFDNASLIWAMSGHRLNPNNFFAKQALEKWKAKIASFCDTINPGEEHYLRNDHYFFFIKRIGDDCCVVATDCELSQTQMDFLSYYLLTIKLDLNTVASDIEKYTKDHKVEELTEELVAVKTMMLDNIEKIIQREEGIEKLVQRTAELSHFPMIVSLARD